MDPRHIRQIYDLLTGLAGERARGLYRLEKYLQMIEERNTVSVMSDDSFDVAAELDEMKRTAAAYDRYPEILIAYAGKYEEMTSKACDVISEIQIVPEE